MVSATYDSLRGLTEDAGLVKGAAKLAVIHGNGEAEETAAEIGMADTGFAR